jgi:hypothetical protein
MKKNKQEIICAKAIADLTSKGYSIFIPVSKEKISFDLIAYNQEDEYYRIKIDDTFSGYISPSKNNKEIDYIALYLEEIDTFVYPSSEFYGETIYFNKIYDGAYGYWYEDFLDLTDKAEKRQIREITISSNLRKRVEPFKDKEFNPKKNKKLLKAQVDSMGYAGTGRLYGVADNTIRYWLGKTETTETAFEHDSMYGTITTTCSGRIITEDTENKQGENE